MRTSPHATIIAALLAPVGLAACAEPERTAVDPAGAGGQPSMLEPPSAQAASLGARNPRGIVPSERGERDQGGTSYVEGELDPWDTCPGEARSLTLSEALVIQGTTAELNDDFYSFCGDASPSAGVGDAVYAITVPSDATLTVNLTAAEGSDLDPALYVGLDACGTHDYCMNFEAGSATETWRAHVEAGTYYFVVDGAAGTTGAFELSFLAETPTCGDGVVVDPEQCDPGAGVTGDGCYDPGGPNECRFEPADAQKDDCPGEAFSIPAGLTMLAASDGHSTIGYTDQNESNVCGNYFGKERVYALTPQATGTMTVTVGLDELGDPICAQNIYDPGCWDYVLYARTTCDSAPTEIGCDDQWWDTPETLTFAVEADTPVYVFVDGFDASSWSQGPFNLHIELTEE